MRDGVHSINCARVHYKIATILFCFDIVFSLIASLATVQVVKQLGILVLVVAKILFIVYESYKVRSYFVLETITNFQEVRVKIVRSSLLMMECLCFINVMVLYELERFSFIHPVQTIALLRLDFSSDST